MYVLLTLFVGLAFVEDASSEDFCRLDTDSRVQYCFDPSFVNGLRRCNTYEPADVILRPGCNAPKHSNYTVPAPKICVNGEWEDIVSCTPVAGNRNNQCTWKGVPGKCVNSYGCLSAAKNIFEEKEKPPTCGNQDGEPMVCCTDCALVNDTRKILFNKRLGFLYKNGGKAHDKCIDYINELDYPCSTNGEKRIETMLDNRNRCYNVVERDSGGNLNPEASSANRNEIPHLALIGYGSDVVSLQWKCGGSLISYNFILTAAHCVNSRFEGPATYVALGIERLTDPPENWHQYKVKSAIIHPNYKPPSKYNDIALLETETPVLFIKGVRPACLHVDGDPGDKASAVAAGSVLAKINLGDTVLPVQQDKYSYEECIIKFPPNTVHIIKNGFDSTTQLCYGDRIGIQDTCVGDSGGPLHSREHYPGRCVFTILGVLSFSRGCRSRDNPETIYTRVQFYVPWIESVVWP